MMWHVSNVDFGVQTTSFVRVGCVVAMFHLIVCDYQMVHPQAARNEKQGVQIVGRPELGVLCVSRF